MDINYKPKTEKPKFNDADVNLAKLIIKNAITLTCKDTSCYWANIEKENSGRVSPEALHQASKQLQIAKKIKLKEDSFEHCMEYIWND